MTSTHDLTFPMLKSTRLFQFLGKIICHTEIGDGAHVTALNRDPYTLHGLLASSTARMKTLNRDTGTGWFGATLLTIGHQIENLQRMQKDVPDVAEMIIKQSKLLQINLGNQGRNVPLAQCKIFYTFIVEFLYGISHRSVSDRTIPAATRAVIDEAVNADESWLSELVEEYNSILTSHSKPTASKFEVLVAFANMYFTYNGRGSRTAKDFPGKFRTMLGHMRTQW